jgi:predicted methyltransferase
MCNNSQISEQKLNTNRLNAQKSTGPKTPEGKATSRLNAVTHGLYTGDIVINSANLKEDQSQYDQLLTSIFDDLKPDGVFQEFLVTQIANCLRRLRRAVRAETGVINRQLDGVGQKLQMTQRTIQMWNNRYKEHKDLLIPDSGETTKADLVAIGLLPEET